MPPTPYPELNAVLRQLVAGIQGVLGDTFLAAYLQGSFATGGFDKDSDVDFIVAVEDELSEEQIESLNRVHDRIYDLDCPWAQYREGSYFPKDVLRTCDQRGKLLWYLEHGDRFLILSEHCNTAVVRWIVHEDGIALAGPSPETLVDPVPVEVLRQEISETMCDWGQEVLAEPERFRNRFYQSFIVLSYCRMLHDLHVGCIDSKRAGAEWAKTVMDPSWAGLIDRTWDGRPNPSLKIRQPVDPKEFESTLKFVRYVIEMSAQYGAE